MSSKYLINEHQIYWVLMDGYQDQVHTFLVELEAEEESQRKC